MKEPITLTPGNVYLVKHTSGIIRAKFINVTTHNTSGGAGGVLRRVRATARYHFTNLATGREITLKSKARIRKEVIGG